MASRLVEKVATKIELLRCNLAAGGDSSSPKYQIVLKRCCDEIIQSIRGSHVDIPAATLVVKAIQESPIPEAAKMLIVDAINDKMGADEAATEPCDRRRQQQSIWRCTTT